MKSLAPKTRVGSMLVCSFALAACGWLAHGQSAAVAPSSAAATPSPTSRVVNVSVVDEQGKAVTDLTGAEFQVFDEGKPYALTGFRLLPSSGTGKTPRTTVILFDLLNTFAGERENSATLIVRSLQPLEAADSVFLYLLTNHGDLYPVHPLAMPPAPGAKPADPPWTKQVRQLLDQAIANVNALRQKDFQDEGVGAAATFFALDELGNAFMKIPGPKTMVWITRGSPNQVDYRYGCKDVVFPEGSQNYVGGRCGDDCVRRAGVNKCVDYTPFLQRFGAKLTRSDTVFTSVMIDPQGTLFGTDRGRPRDTLIQLADLSGGHVYAHGEIDQAITQALQDMGARYQLAYEPPAPNGKYHKLRVECSRKGVHVEAPAGYYPENAHRM
jgi:VWFA-related protein